MENKKDVEEIIEVNRDFEAIVYSGKRIVIPANIRNIYGIKPGCILDLTLLKIRKNNHNAQKSAEENLTLRKPTS